MHLKLRESRDYPLVGIKEANSSKMHLVSYNSYVYNGTQQYGMVKGTVATPKCLLFIVTQIEKSRLSNRTVSVLVLLKWLLLTAYSYITSS